MALVRCPARPVASCIRPDHGRLMCYQCFPNLLEFTFPVPVGGPPMLAGRAVNHGYFMTTDCNVGSATRSDGLAANYLDQGNTPKPSPVRKIAGGVIQTWVASQHLDPDPCAAEAVNKNYALCSYAVDCNNPPRGSTAHVDTWGLTLGAEDNLGLGDYYSEPISEWNANANSNSNIDESLFGISVVVLVYVLGCVLLACFLWACGVFFGYQIGKFISPTKHSRGLYSQAQAHDHDVNLEEEAHNDQMA